MMKTLPFMTLEQCQHHTGLTGNHAAHTVYTTYLHLLPTRAVRYVPVAQCPGRHDDVTPPTPPADPFAGIAAAYGEMDDRDL